MAKGPSTVRGVTPVQRFQTTDGQEFADATAANEHEQGLARVAAIAKVVARFYTDDMGMQHVVDGINANMADLIAAFRNQDNI